jgi:hypothetical protein
MPQADVAVLASSNNMPLTLCMLLSVSVRKLLLAPGGKTPQVTRPEINLKTNKQTNKQTA